MNRQQQRHRQRNRDAVQNVKPVERFFADVPRTEQREPRIGGVGDHVDAAERQQLMPGPFVSQNGVARAMFEPTVMAQTAS